MKRINLNIPDELHSRFKGLCALEGKEMTEIIHRLIQEYIEKAEKRLRFKK